MKQSRVKVNAHAGWRGLLLVYDCMVFGDTSESVDEVPVHVFLLSALGVLDWFLNRLISIIKTIRLQ